jgi:hypothetical protein
MLVLQKLLRGCVFISDVDLYVIIKILLNYRAGIAQSVQPPATGWMTEGSEFES